MANIKSAIKRIKLTEQSTLRNKAAKSAIKTSVKKFEGAVNEGKLEDAQVLLKEATKVIDQAASKGIIHKNNAARKKSDLSLLMNKTSAK